VTTPDIAPTHMGAIPGDVPDFGDLKMNPLTWIRHKWRTYLARRASAADPCWPRRSDI